MDQQQGQGVVSDAAAKVGDTVGNLAADAGKIAQNKLDEAEPVLRDLRASAGAAMDKAADMAQKASTAGVQAVDAIQGVARDVGNQVGQAATTVYQQGARAGGSISKYAAEQPLTALLVAAAIGYGLAYLIHRS